MAKIKFSKEQKSLVKEVVIQHTKAKDDEIATLKKQLEETKAKLEDKNVLDNLEEEEEEGEIEVSDGKSLYDTLFPKESK